MSIINQQMFLEKLARLCEQYNATFGYTTDDDGVHVAINGDDIAIISWEFLNNGRDAATALRTAKDKLK